MKNVEDNGSHPENEITGGAFLFAILIVAFVIWVVWPSKKVLVGSAGENTCVQRGIAYFKEIESYPNLSNGRDATSVAIERCNRTINAFDLN
jgi:hypothetical protein